jgi:hypothetical protein
MVIAPILVISSASTPYPPSSVCRAASTVVTVFHDTSAVPVDNVNNVNSAEEEDAKGALIFTATKSATL